MSINDYIKFLKNGDIKKGFKRTIYWNKYRSERTTKPRSNNLDYLIDPTFRNINRLFELSLNNDENDHARDSFAKNYMPLVEIKDFNALIDNKPFFDRPVKNKQEAYKNLLECQEMMTGNLLDFSYHQNYYKFIGIDLSRQKNTSIPQQINFVGK